MTQTLHILKKDFRRFGFEIGLAMLLLAGCTWSSPRSWMVPDYIQSGIMEFRNEPWLLAALVVIGWAILLVRLIQEESPAGDCQFWVTRPYEWPKLLAAKVLFLLLVVSLPLLLAQMAMLAMAGFSPLHYFPGLLRIQGVLWALILLSSAVIALSSGVMQISRAIFLVLLYLAGAWWLVSTLPNAAAWQGDSIWEWLRESLLIGIALAVVVLQYARRKTNKARLWLVAGALGALAITAVTPYRRLIEARHPVQSAGEQPLLRLQLHPATEHAIRSKGRHVWVSPQLTAGHLAPGYAAEVEAVLVTLEGPDGTRWDSGWQRTYARLTQETFQTADPSQTVWQGLHTVLRMDGGMFDRLKDVPLKARVAVAAMVFREQEGTVITKTENEFELPGTGICVIRGWPAGLLWCRAPLRPPAMLGVSSRIFSHCPPGADELAKPPLEATGWAVNFGSAWEFDMIPVSLFFPIGMTRNDGVYRGTCSGTVLSVRQPQMVGSVRVEAEFEGFKLAGGTPATLEEKK